MFSFYFFISATKQEENQLLDLMNFPVKIEVCSVANNKMSVVIWQKKRIKNFLAGEAVDSFYIFRTSKQKEINYLQFEELFLSNRCVLRTVVLWFDRKKNQWNVAIKFPKLNVFSFKIDGSKSRRNLLTNNFEDFFSRQIDGNSEMSVVIWQKKKSLLECGEQIPRIPKIRR